MAIWFVVAIAVPPLAGTWPLAIPLTRRTSYDGTPCPHEQRVRGLPKRRADLSATPQGDHARRPDTTTRGGVAALPADDRAGWASWLHTTSPPRSPACSPPPESRNCARRCCPRTTPSTASPRVSARKPPAGWPAATTGSRCG